MLRLLAVPLLVVALHPQEPAITPLPKPLRATLEAGFWEAGCPVPLSQLRLLTVRHWGFDGRAHVGQLVVNREAAAPLGWRCVYEVPEPAFRVHRLADGHRSPPPGTVTYHPAFDTL